MQGPSLAQYTHASVSSSVLRNPKQGEQKVGSEARWSQLSAPRKTTLLYTISTTRANGINSTARLAEARPGRPRPGRKQDSLRPRLLPPSKPSGHLPPPLRTHLRPPGAKVLSSSLCQGLMAATRMHVAGLLLQGAGLTQGPSWVLRNPVMLCLPRLASHGLFSAITKV